MSTTPTGEPSLDIPERPGDVIDGAAADAWQAYNAMDTTKRRHFSLLQTLDLKRVNYGIEPTADETKMLAWLLADHDAQVRRFTDASTKLKSDDASAHRQLFEYVGRVARVDTAGAPNDAASRKH